MAKSVSPQTPELDRIKQVIERLNLLVEAAANDLKLKKLDEEQEALIRGQIMGMANALVLLRQVKKRGELWTGGYLDNIGVVFADQVAEYVKKQREILDAS